MILESKTSDWISDFISETLSAGRSSNFLLPPAAVIVAAACSTGNLSCLNKKKTYYSQNTKIKIKIKIKKSLSENVKV